MNQRGIVEWDRIQQRAYDKGFRAGMSLNLRAVLQDRARRVERVREQFREVRQAMVTLELGGIAETRPWWWSRPKAQAAWRSGYRRAMASAKVGA